MFQKVSSLDLVVFGFEDIEQCAIDLDRCDRSVGMMRAKHVEDIALAGGGF